MELFIGQLNNMCICNLSHVWQYIIAFCPSYYMLQLFLWSIHVVTYQAIDWDF